MKVYLAAPFFTDEQKNDKTSIKEILELCDDIEILDPQDYNLGIKGWEMTNHQWGMEVFQGDLNSLEEADVVVAIDYGLYGDNGTAWEIGYAYAKNIPVITIIPDSTIPLPHSLMVCSASKIFIALSRFCLVVACSDQFKNFIEIGHQYNLLGVELK